MGDGGSGGDPCSRAQTLRPADLVTGGSCGSHPSRTLLGKMLRIDVDASTPAGPNNLCAANPDGSAAYAVPAGNPFLGDPLGRCAEIWAYGLRNPWRFSFDRATGEIWIADVGQNTREEVSLEPPGTPGRNYGWRCREGTHVFNTSAPYCNDPGVIASLIPPVLEYPRTSPRCSVTGGYRYRGPAVNLRGLYFFGDYCEGRVLVGYRSGGGWAFLPWSPSSIGNIRTFGEDEAGAALRGDDLHRVSGSPAT
ncbi:MAG: PQQ-dependent sugar dehydrogenase [Xanthomonadales bacterium]|nr:PQQ-dependent sugar dehydrogenase [Xanthomonadales bacterium]